MKKYRQLQVFAIALITIYLIVGYATRFLKTEIYPVFAWSLFTYIPQAEQNGYDLKIRSINNISLETPVYFSQGGEWYKNSHSIVVQFTIRQFAEAILNDRKELFLEKQTLIERVYFAELNQVQYEVVQISFDLRDRWEENQIIEEKIIAVFEKITDEK